MDPARGSKKSACSSMQQARRRFSQRPVLDVEFISYQQGEVGRAVIATPEERKSNNESQSFVQSSPTSKIQHEVVDIENQSLRQEVEQLREALRLATMELSAMKDKEEKELQEERILRLEL
jgi:hypothetical protein